MKQRIVGISVLVLVTVGWSTMSVGEQRPAPQGELHVVDTSPTNWRDIVLNIFEHLIETTRMVPWCQAWPPVGAGSMTAPLKSRSARG